MDQGAHPRRSGRSYFDGWNVSLFFSDTLPWTLISRVSQVSSCHSYLITTTTAPGSHSSCDGISLHMEDLECADSEKGSSHDPSNRPPFSMFCLCLSIENPPTIRRICQSLLGAETVNQTSDVTARTPAKFRSLFLPFFSTPFTMK